MSPTCHVGYRRVRHLGGESNVVALTLHPNAVGAVIYSVKVPLVRRLGQGPSGGRRPEVGLEQSG